MLDLDTLDFEWLADRLRRRFSSRVDRWCAELPARIVDLAARWDLDLEARIGRGRSAITFRCTGPHGVGVLKICPDPSIITEEVQMLRLLLPSGRVPVVFAHEGEAALIEWIGSGVLAEDLPLPPSGTEYAAFLRDLHSVPLPHRPPRRLHGWTEVLFESAKRRGADLGDSPELRDELISTQPREVLLHGDLHLGNVLDGEERGLVAVDPICCVGDPCFDAIDFALEGTTCEEILRRRDELAKAYDLDLERLDRWCRVTAPIAFADASHVKPAHAAAIRAYLDTPPLRG
jgi:streptomycin 6-kinase